MGGVGGWGAHVSTEVQKWVRIQAEPRGFDEAMGLNFAFMNFGAGQGRGRPRARRRHGRFGKWRERIRVRIAAVSFAQCAAGLPRASDWQYALW